MYNLQVSSFAIQLTWNASGIGGGVVAQPYFITHFGLVHDDGTKDVKRANAVSSNVVSVLQAGAFFGALGSAPVSAAVGRKLTLLLFSIIFSVGAVSVIKHIDYLMLIFFKLQILQTVAGGSRGIGYIYAGRVIAGVGVGAISAVAPAFVSECSPKDVRGRITGFFQIMVAVGVMLSYFVNREIIHLISILF